MMRIVLAEDHKTVREGLKMLVNAQTDMEVVGEAGDGAAAIKSVREQHPDIVVMDISMPEMNGLKATRKLKAEFPDIKILTLTRHSDDSFLEQLIGAGASGYILKQSAPAELISAIRTVGGGNAYLDSSLTEKVMGGYLSRGLRVSEKLDFGMIGLNRGLVSDPAAPFGGMKQSGIGREGAHEGLLEFMETQYISVSW